MKPNSKKVGRPSKKDNGIIVRYQFIKTGLDLFTRMPYEKVSTRLISSKVGFSSSLIKYYFGSKEGLYEAVIQEYALPIYEKLQALIKAIIEGSFFTTGELLEKLLAAPLIPNFVVDVMNLPESDFRRKLLERIIGDISDDLYELLLNQLIENGVINQALSGSGKRPSWISLVMFPLMIPTVTSTPSKVMVSDDFLRKSFSRNLEFMIQSLVKIDSERLQVKSQPLFLPVA
ncbi:TetR/AcrR family transcriptional regulator [Vibrio sp. S4M6]|uniref:TetR/AcrR family transcriptional regulator n=1 Tax=Vibrio sinus TaxID=2946865 RepID=UPI00202A470C|nr:TetR/AcrR family transcriptional regulator [Vibrio sinus]MCL9783256.1 TetR/AcrR family transcriptional regulator [Vibrio sinus]